MASIRECTDYLFERELWQHIYDYMTNQLDHENCQESIIEYELLGWQFEPECDLESVLQWMPFP